MLESLINDKFIKNNIVFFAGSIFVSALNYLYNPILGRLLPLEQFGELQAILSLSIQLAIFINVIGMIVVNIVNDREEKEKIFIVKSLQSISILINLFLVITLYIFRNVVGQGLGMNSGISITLIGMYLLILSPLVVRNSHLQAHHKFFDNSVVNLIGSLFKIIIAVGFILLGWGVAGALLGLFLAQVLAYFYAYTKTKNDLGLQKKINFEFLSDPIKRALILKEVTYGLFIFAVIFSVTALYTSDTLVVRLFFPAKETGEYAGIAAIARIIFFLTSSVAGVLLASITPNTDSRHNKSTITKAVTIVLCLTAPALLGFYLFPNLIISILMGKKFLTQASLLAPVGVIVFLAAINNLVFSFFIATRKYFSAVAAITGVVVTILMVSLNHSIINDIIWAYILGNVTTLIGLMVVVIASKERNEIGRKSNISGNTGI